MVKSRLRKWLLIIGLSMLVVGFALLGLLLGKYAGASEQSCGNVSEEAQGGCLWEFFKSKGSLTASLYVVGGLSLSLAPLVFITWFIMWLIARLKPSHKCPHCGARVPAGNSFCGQCGMTKSSSAVAHQPVEYPSSTMDPTQVVAPSVPMAHASPSGHCPRCGASLREGAVFCGKCGGSISTATVPPSPAPAEMPTQVVAEGANPTRDKTVIRPPDSQDQPVPPA